MLSIGNRARTLVALPRAMGTALARLARNRRGNVFIIVAFAMIPMVFATGMGIDYSRAARLRTKLNAIADAAALAAVTQSAMQKTDAEAKTIATNMFNAQATDLPSLIFDSSGLTVTITPTYGATIGRIAKVSYVAESENAFGGILGRPTITIAGTATAKASKAPNIDFYVMFDVSSSMLLPATSEGITAMLKATSKQNGGQGCAFACHQSWRGTKDRPGWSTKDAKNQDNEIQFNPKDGTYTVMDNYMLARSVGIVLRTDLVSQAIADLTQVAEETSADNEATYRMGLADFDFSYRRIWPTSKSDDGFYVDDDLDRVQTHVADSEIVPYFVNNWRTETNHDNDTGTATNVAFQGALDTMPNVAGTGADGEDPQAILFLITDGMRDEASGGRKLGPIDTAQCAKVKNRGIRIAVLYTEYLPGSATGSWSINNVRKPFLDDPEKISPALRECATNPDGSVLFYKVSTDDDISAALAALFRQAVATAHLTQ